MIMTYGVNLFKNVSRKGYMVDGLTIKAYPRVAYFFAGIVWDSFLGYSDQTWEILVLICYENGLSFFLVKQKSFFIKRSLMANMVIYALLLSSPRFSLVLKFLFNNRCYPAIMYSSRG